MKNPEFQMLKLRNLVADKEWLTASANHELARYGEWQCNWHEGILQVDQEIEKLIVEIDNEK